MAIENARQLARSYEVLAKMYKRRDETRQDSEIDPSTRDALVLSVENALHKVEREVYEYLCTSYGAANAAKESAERDKQLVA